MEGAVCYFCEPIGLLGRGWGLRGEYQPDLWGERHLLLFWEDCFDLRWRLKLWGS